MLLDPLECTGQPPIAQNRLAQRGIESTPIPGITLLPRGPAKVFSKLLTPCPHSGTTVGPVLGRGTPE